MIKIKMSSATFEANPNRDNEPWIEKPAIEGLQFRIWHLMFFCLCAFGVLVVLICCCIRVRVPRTKQEIEGDYKRKKITRKFRKRLKFISNHDMEAINLMKALEIIMEADNKEHQQDQQITSDLKITNENEDLVTSKETRKSNFGKKVTNLIKIGNLSLKPDCST